MLIPLVVAAALIAAVLLRRTSSPSTGPRYAAVGGTVTPGSLPGIQTGLLPWPPEVAHLLARLRAIALPWLASEGTALHIHQHLDLFVDGRRVPVPADVGISATGGFLAPIHTHDASGVIHVESSTRRAFTLGELFDVWGVRFTDSCLGGYCTGGGRTLGSSWTVTPPPATSAGSSCSRTRRSPWCTAPTPSCPVRYPPATRSSSACDAARHGRPSWGGRPPGPGWWARPSR